MVVQAPAAAAPAAVQPALRGNLDEEIDNKDVAAKRREVASALNITDKTHSTTRISHGANFSSNQTLRNLINDLTSKVQGDAEIERVGRRCRELYGYDPWA